MMFSIRSSSKPSLTINNCSDDEILSISLKIKNCLIMDTKQLFEKYESEICEICIREGFCSVSPYSLCEGQGCESACFAFAEENDIDIEN